MPDTIRLHSLEIALTEDDSVNHVTVFYQDLSTEGPVVNHEYDWTLTDDWETSLLEAIAGRVGDDVELEASPLS